jgi:hypothetical protein
MLSDNNYIGVGCSSVTGGININEAPRTYLKINSSSWKTEKKSSKGALKLEVPKMTKMS